MFDLCNLFLLGCPEQANDEFNLFLSAVSLEERHARDHLSEDASDRPHVDRPRVVCARAEDLWRSIETRADMLNQWACPGLIRRAHVCETETTYFQIATATQKEIAGLQIAMNNLRGVYVLDSAKHLV